MAPRKIIDWRQLSERLGLITTRRTRVSGQQSVSTIGMTPNGMRCRITKQTRPVRFGTGGEVIARLAHIQANLMWIRKKTFYGFCRR
jgi:hypothetical protein